MSIVAEFAYELQKKYKCADTNPPCALSYPSLKDKLYDIKAVIFDVYGTLIHYWRPEFNSEDTKRIGVLEAFRKTVDSFRMADSLADINPEEEPQKTLMDFYHGLIALNHEKSLRKGIGFPEVKIEEVWHTVILLLKRHGYDIMQLSLGDEHDVAKCMAFFYNFHSLGRGFFPGVVDALVELKKNNIMLGILSNAQFYTSIDLTLFLRDQSNGRFEDHQELFDNSLTFFSYEYGASKLNITMMRKLYDSLHEFQILPSQTVFVGNDLSADIRPAAEAGLRTAFFSGDKNCAFVHDLDGKVIPDISFSRWEELPERLSFYEDN